MSKKLTMNLVKTEADKFNHRIKKSINDELHVFIYPNFSPIKIRDMISEMMKDIDKAKEEGLEFNVRFSQWGLFHIIKYFADLEIPDEINDKLKAYFMLVETGYFEQVLSVFPSEQIEKIGKALETVTESLNRFMEMDKEEQENILKVAMGVDDEVIQDIIDKAEKSKQ